MVINMVTIKEFAITDYESALTLWQNTEGVCNCEKCTLLDSKENIEKFLNRNPGLSFIAVENGIVKGVVLAGHDGRTGIIYRLTVSEKLRENGIGKQLVEKAVNGLKHEGLTIVKAFVLKDNNGGNAFWDKIGFTENNTAVTRFKIL
ncbi:MAG: GNAT family N-acetyltransferase [Oscillospiraceae bacterium]|nr:GNAT family N-acetyltransferase [Oscillospiraceae bacterium]